MGVSTDAILFYGYCWEEETDRPWTLGRESGGEDPDEDDDPDMDWRNRYARVHGVLRPALPYPERLDARGRTPSDHTPEEQAIIDQHSAYFKKKCEIAEASHCDIYTHCSNECPMPYVCIKASRIRSWRGHMNEVKSLAVDPAWDGELAAFCAKMGIRTEGLRPAWWLVSNWC